MHQTTEPQTHKVKADGAKRCRPTGSYNWGFNTASLNRWLQRRRGHPTPVLLPGKAHGWRSLVGCSPWGREESDATKRLHFHFSLSCTGEGNGNPLQCSCLENPRDRGAWWAAIYGVAQSQTRLKQLSSSSNRWLNYSKNTERLNNMWTNRNNWYMWVLYSIMIKKKYTFCFQATLKHLSDHTWGQKTNLDKCERAEVVQSVCSLTTVESWLGLG